MKKGDRVVVYMPTSPYVVASMMACARIGAVHRFVYLSSRISEQDAVLLLCSILVVALFPGNVNKVIQLVVTLVYLFKYLHHTLW